MSTDANQLANNESETLSLNETLVQGFKEIEERNNAEDGETGGNAENLDNQAAANGDQGQDDETQLRQQSEQQSEHDSGQQIEGDQLEDGQTGERNDGDEVHHPDGSEDAGQHDRQGLQVSQELQSTFDYLPKDAKEHLEEAGYDEETTNNFLGLVKSQNDKYLEKTKDFSELIKVIEPYKDALAKAGVSSAQKIAGYIATEEAILRDPKQGLIQLATSLGFDLEKLFSGGQSSPNDGNNGNADNSASDSQNFEDPVQRDINKINERLDGNDKAKLKEVYDNAQTAIDTFANATNSNGDKVHPHFEKIRPLMAVKIQKNECGTMEEAYDSVLKDLNLTPVSNDGNKGNGNNAQNSGNKGRKSIKAKKKAGSGVKSTSTAKSSGTKGTMKEDLVAGVSDILNGKR